MKKKILGGALLVIAIVAVVVLSIMFKDTSQYNVSLREESIIVSINPEVLFNTDNKGYVKEVLHINEDAKIYKEEDFLGLEIKEAVDKTIEVAKEHGYVNEDTVVNVSSLSENSVYVEDIVLNLKGNKINVKTEKIPKDAIETIMSNIDTTGNVETEFIVLDDGYVIIRKHSNIEGPGPSEDELNNQTETNNSNSNNQEEEQKKEENKQNTTTNNNTTNNNQNNTNNNSSKNEETTNNNTKPVEKAYLSFRDLYSLEKVKEIENKYNIKINLIADATCGGYLDGGDPQLIENGKTYTAHIHSLEPYIQDGGCGVVDTPKEYQCIDEHELICAENLMSRPELLACAKEMENLHNEYLNFVNNNNNIAPLISDINISKYTLLKKGGIQNWDDNTGYGQYFSCKNGEDFEGELTLMLDFRR